MSTTHAIRLFLLLAAVALPTVTKASEPQRSPAKAARASKESGVPRLYVATGPSSEADLARLRAAIGKLAGVTKVEARAEFDAVTVTIDGDGRSTESLLTAAGKSAGFLMRPARSRYYAATGPNGEADLSRLRQTLEKVEGVEEVALSAQADGAAVRILGVRGYPALAEAAKPVGFTLRPVASYVTAGPSTETDLNRLRAALGKVAGVEQVALQGLTGGATLLIYGDAQDAPLVATAKSTGFALWPLNNASGPRVFRVGGGSSAANPQKLRQALQGLEGIGEIEFHTASDGQRVSVLGGKARPEGIVAAAAEAGFTLTPIEIVSLPTLLPEAGRSTPPDYEQRVLEEKANLGEPAPEFTVRGIDGASRRSLADYLAAKKPVVLIFGSCTCPRFMGACAPLERLYQTYKDRVTFLLVYIAEAHPGQILSVPTEKGGKELRVIPQIATESELLDNLRRLVRLAHLTIPAAIDNPEKSLNEDYAAYPNRLYAIGVDGKVAFKGAPGPTGLKVPDLADWLHENVK